MSSLEELKTKTRETLNQVRKLYEKTDGHASNYLVIHLLNDEIDNASQKRLEEMNTNLEKLLFENV